MIDINKPVQTRDGLAATILATDVRATLPYVYAIRYVGQTILAEITDPDGSKALRYFYDNGAYLKRDHKDPTDLVNVPTTTYERFIFVYAHTPDRAPRVNEVKASPDHFPRSVGDPVIRIVYEDGKPVSSEIVTSL